MYQYTGGGRECPCHMWRLENNLGVGPGFHPLWLGVFCLQLRAPGEPLGTFASASLLAEERLGLQIHSTTSSFMWCPVMLTQIPTLCDKSFTEPTP